MCELIIAGLLVTVLVVTWLLLAILASIDNGDD